MKDLSTLPEHNIQVLPADLAICILILPWCGCRITVMSNVWCPFLIDRLLIYQIAILLSMGGQKQLGKMFGFDCRRFLFYLTPIPFSLTPSHCSPFFCSPQVLPRVLDPSARKRKGNGFFAGYCSVPICSQNTKDEKQIVVCLLAIGCSECRKLPTFIPRNCLQCRW